jgi:4-amino-4-deoxy-L-arabinose transferase-like glycosyltransferase
MRRGILLFLIASAAIFLRVYAIDRLPPGLFGDEAVEGLDALDVLVGNFAIWFHAHLGREPLYVYLAALSYRAFGVTPLATRLPAIIAGLLTIPAAFFFAREWALATFSNERAKRIALLTTALLAISFWHIQMTRDAHRVVLLPLVEAIGYGMLWRAIRTCGWKMYAAAGAVLGLAIYTYSPGRFVGVFIALFFGIEFLLARLGKTSEATKTLEVLTDNWRGWVAAALLAILVMLPLGIYFVQNPAQFSRRFESVSIFDADSPALALATSVTGNLAQFVVPGAGYQSKHYNLPGKPIFDLWIAPWFLVGIGIAFARWRQAAYRFLILWFIVLMTPAFLTADMIPKGVRGLGVVPGVFVFPVLAMDVLLERARSAWQRASIALITLSFVGSAAWTTYDYFVAWANLPELPPKFDADMVEVSEFIRRMPPEQPIYVSTEVYRHPTLMLLSKRVPTSQYFDRATRDREFDARAAFVSRENESNALYIFVREVQPPREWLTRLTPRATQVEQGKYFVVYRLGGIAAPQQTLDVLFNPLVRLIGYSRYTDEPRGIGLYWQVVQLPTDRAEIQATLSLADVRGVAVAEDRHPLGVPPLEWAIGDTIVEWYTLDMSESVSQFRVEIVRGVAAWQSPVLSLK